ncbi:MAG: PriCT-2 domain-containing protein, partial [Planctomycetales bacterium]|nr:PriCT-2 domain-containing protein [Planctomycetales bacterium]
MVSPTTGIFVLAEWSESVIAAPSELPAPVLDRAKAIRERLLNGEKMPSRLPINVEGIPDELKQVDRWVCWKWYRKGSKWSKMPLQATLKAASSTDPTTWTSFETVVQAIKKWPQIAGIGFVLGDGFAGIDLDKCYDPDADEADEIIHTVTEKISSYTEISPSKTGVKILVKGNKPKGGTQSGSDAKYDVECYDHGRFFTITGSRWPETVAEVNERTDELAWFHETYVDPGAKDREQKSTNWDPFPTSSADDIEKAREALQHISSSYAENYSDWIKVGIACRCVGGDVLLGDWISWSSKSGKYDGRDACVAKWNSFDSNSKVGVGTLVKLGQESGWEPSWKGQKKKRKKKSGPKLDQPEESWLRSDEQRTENALATRFIDRFGKDLRFVPQWNKWLVWDGKRFKIDDASAMVLSLGRKFARALWKDVASFIAQATTDDSEASTATSFVRAANRKSGIEAFVMLSRADSRVLTPFDQLDAHPMLLNLQNGTF